MRKLKLFNGRGHGLYMGKHHFYIAAYSIADAERVLQEALGYGKWQTELRNYYSKDCWGTRMNAITPERGLWACEEPNGKPFKIG